MNAYLVSAPLKANHEEQQTRDRQKTTNIVDLAKNLTARKARRVDARRWEVKYGSQGQSNKSPKTAKKTDVPPGTVRGDKLAPEHTRTERYNGKDEN
jgi:hypothetical protein